MSHYRLKTKYQEEGAYGSTEEKTLYTHINNSCDRVLFYDENGDFIFSFPDTLDGNILDAINRMNGPFKKLDSGFELIEGVEYVPYEEWKEKIETNSSSLLLTKSLIDEIVDYVMRESKADDYLPDEDLEEIKKELYSKYKI